MRLPPRIAGRSLAVAALLAATAPSATPALAAQPTGVFSITPAQRVIAAEPPVEISPMTVRNTTPTTFRVRVFAAPLTQAPDGGYSFSTAPADLVTARKILSVGPKRFTLRTGESQAIGLRWNLLPLHAKAAPIAVVVAGTPARQSSAQGVQNILQIVGTHFLRLPGHFATRGRLEGLTASQGPGKSLVFRSRVRNRGQVYAKPSRTRLVVRDAAGQVVTRTHWRTGLILPGKAREFPVLARHLLPAGRYTAESTMHFGPSKRVQRTQTTFTLTAPNRLPTSDVRVLGLSVTGHAGESAVAHVSVRNVGTRAARASLAVTLMGYRGAVLDRRPLARKAVALGSLAPGKRIDVDVDLGKVAKHPYQVSANLVGDERPIASATAGFAPLPKRSFTTKVGDWISRHAVAIVLVLALLAVGAVGALGLRSRRRLEAELARARAGTPAPRPAATSAATRPAPRRRAGLDTRRTNGHPPSAAQSTRTQRRARASDECVHLNSSTAEELARLLAIDAAAARRIVVHREQRGPFGSIADLRAVEGFDAATIAQLLWRVRIEL